MTCDFLAPTALHIGKAAGVIPYPILQMENNEVQEGALTHIKAESGSKREGCCLEELPSQKTKDPCRCPTLPPAPCLLPLEKGMPHTLLWARLCSTTIHPHPTYRYTNVGEMGAGTQLVKHCLPSRNSSQE